MLFAAPSADCRRTVTLEHYRALFDERDFLVPIRNSLIVAATTTAARRFRSPRCAPTRWRACASAAGRRCSRSCWRCRCSRRSRSCRRCIWCCATLGLIDTYPGSGAAVPDLPHAARDLAAAGFFRQLPPELEDAAMLDGASRAARAVGRRRCRWPRPALATTAILTFIYCWNEFLFALSFTLGPDRRRCRSRSRSSAASIRCPGARCSPRPSWPRCRSRSLVLAFQRRIVAGLTAGAIKGRLMASDPAAKASTKIYANGTRR